MTAANLKRVREFITDVMGQIEQPPRGKILHPWLSVTHGVHYAAIIFTWDYHHAALRFAVGDRAEYLRFLVDNLLSYQQSDGLTPAGIHVERGPCFTEPPYHSTPFLFQAAFLYVHGAGEAWPGDERIEGADIYGPRAGSTRPLGGLCDDSDDIQRN